MHQAHDVEVTQPRQQSAPDDTAPVNLALKSAQAIGPAVKLIYTRPEND